VIADKQSKNIKILFMCNYSKIPVRSGSCASAHFLDAANLHDEGLGFHRYYTLLRWFIGKGRPP